MISFFVPPDNEKAQMQPDGKGYWGVCGPSTIAVLTKKSVMEIISLWASPFRGFSPWVEMEATLKKLGYAPIVRRRGNKAREFPNPLTSAAIVRIQWLQDDGTEFYWRARTPNTHYVLMQKDPDGEWWIFCNSWLWFRKNSVKGKAYLKLGYVSSYYELPETDTQLHLNS